MKEFELSNPTILGEEHPTYGFTFWDAQVNGAYPIMFNSKEGNIMPGTRIQAETAELKTSKNGKDYLRLKKVKFEDSPQTSAPFEPKAKPTFQKATEAEDKRGDGITASMAFKLGYQGFIQTEQMQPKDPIHWAFVKEQGRQIYWGIKAVMSSQPDGGSQVTEVPTPSPQPIKAVPDSPATTSLGDTFRNRTKEPEYTESDMPEDI